jgi:hypothetical protein
VGLADFGEPVAESNRMRHPRRPGDVLRGVRALLLLGQIAVGVREHVDRRGIHPPHLLYLRDVNQGTAPSSVDLWAVERQAAVAS